MITLEVCTGSLQSVRAAARAGAHRAEICAALEVGGITPSLGHLRQALAVEGIRKNVLIRPRGGDFHYSETEIEAMLHDIALCRQLGADGIVTGALTADGQIDIPACQRLAQAAEGMDLTFHRAFDVCQDPTTALEQIITLGYKRLLTSGQAATALEGLPLITSLVSQAAGRISIMPGSGVNATNAAHILQQSGATEIHASARGDLAHDGPLFPGIFETSEDKVAQILGEIAKK